MSSAGDYLLFIVWDVDINLNPDEVAYIKYVNCDQLKELLRKADAGEEVESGSKIFSTFIGFLESKDPNDGTEQALLNELSSFNDYLKENGPFINGKDISAADLSLSLGPKLYHLEIALGHFKKWKIPDSLPFLKSYFEV
ncbi:unnamed protein product [Trifolium pratense]|uniref:Uncharacterized protein n=1 Tax=Trifolium pratense TaxID=57577 RepID=A0ACB0JBA9_TRIPR|nr:unnamed protein product [Trifolium pratense]